MKIKFIGVQHMKGTSQKSGNEYDFAKLMYAVEIEPVNKAHCQIKGYGSEVRDVALDSKCIDDFAGRKLGEELLIALSTDPRNLSKTVCVGLAKASA